MTSAPSNVIAPSSPPWSATSSVLLAFAALSLTMNAEVVGRASFGWGAMSIAVIAPIVFATVAILVSLLVNARLERGQPAIWIVRIGVFLAVFLFALATTERINASFYMNFVARVFSLGFVAEAALQHWQRPPTGQQRTAILVFLAAILFVLASRTSNEKYIRYFTPPFIMLLVYSMRASRSRLDDPSGASRPWLAAMAVAIILGCAMSISISKHHGELERLLLAILRPSNVKEFSDVNARPMIGKSFNLPLSQKRVFKIEGTLAERHMRGMTFESYATTGAWIPSIDSAHSEFADTLLRARPGGQRLTLTSMIENLPVLYLPLHMDGVDAKTYHLNWSREWGGAVYATSILRGNEPYQISIVNETHPGPLVKLMTERVRARCLDLPPDIDPRVVAIGHALDAGTTSPYEKLESIRKYLNKNHSYSLTVEPGPGDPVANFIIQKRDGHCQYFAAASVLLLRSIGIPARYVTGYYAHESPQTEVTVVRQRDAHAWAEAWIDGTGWVTFDATPSGGMPGQSGTIAYWERLWEKMGDFAETIGAWLRGSPFSVLALIASVFVALGLGVNWIRTWRSTVRQSVSSIKYATPRWEFDALAVRFDSWLRRRGVPCPLQLPWVDHIQNLKQVSPGATEKKALPPIADLDAVEAFVRDYSDARFGGSVAPETIRKLSTQLRELK